MTATYQDNYEAWKELKLQYDFTSKYLHTTAKSIFGIAKFFDYAFDILFVCLWVEGIIHNWATAVLASILALSLFSIKVIVYRRAAKYSANRDFFLLTVLFLHTTMYKPLFQGNRFCNEKKEFHVAIIHKREGRKLQPSLLCMLSMQKKFILP